MVDDGRGGRDIQCERFPEHAGAITQMDQNLYWNINQKEHQTKIPGTHMVLAALEFGIGSCWVSRFEVKRLSELLALPKGLLSSEILLFGYPASPKKSASKKSLTELVFYNYFRPNKIS